LPRLLEREAVDGIKKIPHLERSPEGA